MNLPVGSECFIPSVNAKADAGFIGGNLLLPETHESIAVFESRNMVVRIIGSPKPTFTVFDPVSITCKPLVLLVLVKVCEFVEFALYHEKITANLRFRAL